MNENKKRSWKHRGTSLIRDLAIRVVFISRETTSLQNNNHSHDACRCGLTWIMENSNVFGFLFFFWERENCPSFSKTQSGILITVKSDSVNNSTRQPVSPHHSPKNRYTHTHTQIRCFRFSMARRWQILRGSQVRSVPRNRKVFLLCVDQLKWTWSVEILPCEAARIVHTLNPPIKGCFGNEWGTGASCLRLRPYRNHFSQRH